MGTYVETSRYEWIDTWEIYEGTLSYSFEQISDSTVFFGVSYDAERLDNSGTPVGGDAIMSMVSGFYLTGTDLALNSDGDGIDGSIDSFQLAYIIEDSLSTADYLFTFDLNAASVTFDELTQDYTSPASFLYGTNGALFADILTDTWVNDVIKLSIAGTGGDDVIDTPFVDMKVVIEGMDGDDFLSLYGSYGRIDGGAGADIIHGYGASDTKTSTLSDADTLSILQGGEGQDTIYYYYGVNNITGQEGGDTIIFAGVDTEDDFIEATILGKQGADHITVGGDKATVNGNGGTDTLVLAAELNIASGGKDADVFEFDISQSGLIRIRDFEIGVDMLNITGGFTVEDFEDLAFENNNGHTKLFVGDLEVTLIDTNLEALLASDFMETSDAMM